MRPRALLLVLVALLAALGAAGCGSAKRAAAPKLMRHGFHVPPLVTYPSVGVTLVSNRGGQRPAVSRAAVVRLLRSSRLAFGPGRPSLRLQAVKNAGAPGGSYPAWVFTYRHTRPVSLGVPETPDCTSVVIYDIASRAWTWRFQSCPGGKGASPWCDSGCTPANQGTLDAAASTARRIAGAYYTGLVVSDATNSVILYLAHAPASVLDRLNAAAPGVYTIKNDAPRPLSAVMKAMRSLSFNALKREGITISGIGPTQDGYLQVGVTAHVAEAQVSLDAKYGPGLVKVVKEELSMPAVATRRVGSSR